MKERFYGHYATQVYLPMSALSRKYREFSRRIRGKQDRFQHAMGLPAISWRNCTSSRTPRIFEPKKANGNVRISELAILSAIASDCCDSSNIFEIGTFDGRTTLNLAMNAPPNCKIYTIDLPPSTTTMYELDDGERHMVNKQASGVRYEKYRSKHPMVVSRIHQLFGDSAAFDYSNFINTCSLVFVDGSHSYDYVLSDSHIAMEIVQEGGAIVWHDYGIWPGVSKALDDFELRKRIGLQRIRGTSLVFWRKG